MPYISQNDRGKLNELIDLLAAEIVPDVRTNRLLLAAYANAFDEIVRYVRSVMACGGSDSNSPAAMLGAQIAANAQALGYECAELGELNYVLTRLIQRVPQLLVESGAWKSEYRYWVHPITSQALTELSQKTMRWGDGIAGVFDDVKAEYKRRMNVPYETAQILKSGDCFDGPYYTRVLEVVNEAGYSVGQLEVQMPRSSATLGLDALELQLVARRKQ